MTRWEKNCKDMVEIDTNAAKEALEIKHKFFAKLVMEIADIKNDSYKKAYRRNKRNKWI